MINFIRGIVTKSVSAALNFMRIDFTGRTDETIKNKIALQQYGFQSRPNDGAHVLSLVNGENIIVISIDDDTSKIALNEGEISVGYNSNNRILLKSNGDVEIKFSGKCIINPVGNIELGSTLKKLINEEAASIFNDHGHIAISVGQPTSKPITEGAPLPPTPPTTAAVIDNNSMTTKTKAE